MAALGWTWTWTWALLLLAQAVGGVLRGPPGPPWDDDSLLQYVDDGPGQCDLGVWACMRRDLAASLGDILAADQYNVTPVLVVERVRFPEKDADVDRMAVSLNEAGLPTLASTAIKVFETHALVWKLWPGMLHLKIFRDPDEGMDAAVEVPPSDGSRTWGLGAIAARRRLTMALLPIMYKMGVGTTLLGVLVFIALKTMFMVSILFVLAVTSFAKHKLAALTQHHGPPAYYYPPPPHHQKEVHVHVHADPHKQAYGGWNRYGSHGLHGVDVQQPVYPPSPYHSAPTSGDGYYESEPPSHYHRRVGVGAAGVNPYAPLPLPHAQIMSRWDPLGYPSYPGYAPTANKEPDLYSRSQQS